MDSLQVPKGTSVPFFVELCAGSAKLSDAVKQHGYHIIAVDHDKNRHAPRCKIIQLDLSHEHAWDMLDFFVGESNNFGRPHSATLWHMFQSQRHPHEGWNKGTSAT